MVHREKIKGIGIVTFVTNELQLMQFYLFNNSPKLHHRKWSKLRVTAHCLKLGNVSLGGFPFIPGLYR